MIHISLFSGIGGFEIAAEWMGWRNLVSCDINEFGNKVRKYYWPYGYCHTDIKTLTYEKINSELSARFGTGWRDDDIILTGGFPCQPYSAAGKRLGKEDERHLWPEMLRVIQEVKPTYIVGENVRGLTNWNGGVVFEEVCADLENCGYEVQPLLLPACSVGAPHRRDRVWFVAYSNMRGGCWQKGIRKYDLSGSKEQKSDYNIIKTNKRLEQWNIAISSPQPNCDGLDQCDCKHEIKPSQGGQHAFGDTKQGDGDGTAADTDSKRYSNTSRRKNYYEEWKNGEEKQENWNRVRTEISGYSRTAADTSGSGLQIRSESTSRRIGQMGEEWDFFDRWENFPTQSPICSGDDGLPTQLDGITFSKWRNESIKAYGNAIVPQVAFEIFKALVQGK